MQLTPNEIDRVEDAGMLDGNKVSLIRTKGGFWLAVGKRKNKNSEEALAAGSHPAIVKYNLEKQYSGFQPTMTKSEHGMEPIVTKHSHFLDEDLRKSGYDIFSLQVGSEINFHITKQDADVAIVNANLMQDDLYIDKLDIPKKFSKSLAGAVVESAISHKVGLKLKKHEKM